jgi:glycosyltransferase involved in cell wall biosynthesis
MTTDAVGGVWRYTLDLAAGFAARGVGTVLAVLGPAPDLGQRGEARRIGAELIATGLALDWTANNLTELTAAIDHLRALASRAGVASVHLHAPALAASGWRLPAVAVAHSCVATWWRAVRGGALPEDFRWRTEATASGLRAVDAVLAPTAAHAAALREVYGPIPVHVVHNGSIFSIEPSPSGRGQGEGGASGRTLTPPLSRREREKARGVLTAGRLWDEGKNVAALDRVAPLLGAPISAAGPTTGPNGAAVDLPNLRLLGNLDPAGMARAFASASVFASMAKYEPFGLSVLEAARAGLRLVLADIPTFRELWDGAASFVRDESELLPALQHALDSADDGAAQTRAARYSIDATVEATLALHRSVGALV